MLNSASCIACSPLVLLRKVIGLIRNDHEAKCPNQTDAVRFAIAFYLLLLLILVLHAIKCNSACWRTSVLALILLIGTSAGLADLFPIICFDCPGFLPECKSCELSVKEINGPPFYV